MLHILEPTNPLNSLGILFEFFFQKQIKLMSSLVMGNYGHLYTVSAFIQTKLLLFNLENDQQINQGYKNIQTCCLKC